MLDLFMLLSLDLCPLHIGLCFSQEPRSKWMKIIKIQDWAKPVSKLYLLESKFTKLVSKDLFLLDKWHFYE